MCPPVKDNPHEPRVLSVTLILRSSYVSFTYAYGNWVSFKLKKGTEILLFTSDLLGRVNLDSDPTDESISSGHRPLVR